MEVLVSDYDNAERMDSTGKATLLMKCFFSLLPIKLKSLHPKRTCSNKTDYTNFTQACSGKTLSKKLMNRFEYSLGSTADIVKGLNRRDL